MNQMRNIVYHLMKMMKSKGLNDSDITLRLKKMGKNIAATEMTLFNFENSQPADLIRKIYEIILDSKVEIINESVNNKSASVFAVDDPKCPLCKYKRDDIVVSPCEIISSMVAEILRKKGIKIIDSHVKESRSLGGLTCIHKYEIILEGD
jgi:hypothetical protein